MSIASALSRIDQISAMIAPPAASSAPAAAATTPAPGFQATLDRDNTPAKQPKTRAGSPSIKSRG